MDVAETPSIVDQADKHADLKAAGLIQEQANGDALVNQGASEAEV